jgi:hypothetical protein
MRATASSVRSIAYSATVSSGQYVEARLCAYRAALASITPTVQAILKS